MGISAKAFGERIRGTQPKRESVPTNYKHSQQSDIYPLQNPINRGWGVANQGLDPADRKANGRMTDQKGNTIDFFVDEIEASFSMTGSTAQSRMVRQFMPHNVVQPTITVIGRAPNNFQYNRLASFVRASHFNALNLAEQTRETITTSGKKVKTETVRLVIRNGEQPLVWNGKPDKNGNFKHVKGVHVPWQVEGYIKSIKAGGERFNFAPKFEFEFYVAESIFKQGNINMGMWSDVRVYGAELKPWLDWISKKGIVQPDKASANTLDAKEKKKSNPVERDYTHNHEDPGSSAYDTPAIMREPTPGYHAVPDNEGGSVWVPNE